MAEISANTVNAPRGAVQTVASVSRDDRWANHPCRFSIAIGGPPQPTAPKSKPALTGLAEQSPWRNQEVLRRINHRSRLDHTLAAARIQRPTVIGPSCQTATRALGLASMIKHVIVVATSDRCFGG